ncbi:unnamed protein product [Prunus armeniaca]
MRGWDPDVLLVELRVVRDGDGDGCGGGDYMIIIGCARGEARTNQQKLLPPLVPSAMLPLQINLSHEPSVCFLIKHPQSFHSQWIFDTSSKNKIETTANKTIQGFQVIKEMNKRCRTFFWGRDSTPPIAWKDVCMPKDLGGLGVKLANQFNLAALAKLGQVLCKGLRWVMGNGGSIPFWTSQWVMSFPLLDLIPEHQRGPMNLDQKVSDFITNKNWDRNKLSQVLDDDLIDKILTIHLPRSNLHDKIVWGPNANGSFTIKSAYNVQIQERPSHPMLICLRKCGSLIFLRNFHRLCHPELHGHVLLAGSNNVGENSINVAESIALQDGLDAAIERGWDQIIVEGDSKLVIDSTVKKASPPWSIQ